MYKQFIYLKMSFESVARCPCPPRLDDGFRCKASEIAHLEFIAQAQEYGLGSASSMASNMVFMPLT